MFYNKLFSTTRNITASDALPHINEWASLKTRLHKAYEQRFIAYSDSKSVGSLRVTAYLSYVGEMQRLRDAPLIRLQGEFLGVEHPDT